MQDAAYPAQGKAQLLSDRHDVVMCWSHCEVPRLKQHRKASGNPPHRVCDAPWLHHAAKPAHLSCAVDRLRFVAGTAAQL